MRVRAICTPVFQEREDLFAFITKHIPSLTDGTILVVASKIVALSEGRTANADQKETLIRKESSWVRKILPKWWLTVRDGVVIVNAGIDESNADGKIILLPRDCFASAARLRKKLLQRYKITRLGIIISDSRIAPLRAGVTGVALGYAGIKGVRDYRGTADIFGKRMDVTQTNVADCLATAAVLVMGEGSERQPLTVIEDAPVEFRERTLRGEVRIPLKHDMYRALFARP